EARDAVSLYFKRVYEVVLPRESVIVSNSGKQVLFNVLMAMLDQGDEVLFPCPYWLSYPDMIRLAGGVPVPVSPETVNSKIEVSDLEKAFTPKSRILILNSPGNPTGICYTQDELEAMAKWAVERGLFVISDEMYDQLCYLPGGLSSLSRLLPKFPEQIFIVNGLAKSFAMPGWRVGYGLGAPELIAKMSTLQGQSTSNICSLSQAATVAALTGPYDTVEEMRRVYMQRRNLAMNHISLWPNVSCPRPDGAFYIFLNISRLFTDEIPNDIAMCTHLMTRAGVALVPGTPFGDNRCLRLSYSTDEATLNLALEKLSPYLGV
ncbi:MAG: aminotransferase class I/II-fold pyridoxal phosphate-dependent enzyme, partial [Desulfovibrionaceae bacterium]|nr:aminotransferase class I/II-fold pyridoxal phosphate-dependent enzyme [Desulfovibrionaceae bacterium]